MQTVIKHKKMSTNMNRFGEQIEDYDIQNELGTGGFATVYKAKCRNTGRYVAIKMINKIKMGQQNGMQGRVQQEVNIHLRLKHPSIIECYTCFEDNTYVYLVLELAEYGDLKQFLNKEQKCVSVNDYEAAVIIQQVVSGLLYLHSNNIMHRDLSLTNLLVTSDNKVKIADFGLTTQLTQLNEAHYTMCGTPNYISPEVATRSPHDLKTDVWSLGCILYTLLVGKPPFHTDAVKKTLYRVIDVDYKIPTCVSPNANDLISKLLKKNVNERISLEEVLDHPFMSNHHRNSFHSTTGYQRTTVSSDSGCRTLSSRNNSQDTSNGTYASRFVEPFGMHKMSSRDSDSGAFNTPDCVQHRYPNRFGSMEIQTSTPQMGYSGISSHSDKMFNGMPRVRSFQNTPENCTGALRTNSVSNQENMDCYGLFEQNLQTNKFSTNINLVNHPTTPCTPILSEPLHAMEKPNVPQLNTARLLPTRQETKRGILSILSTGEVVIELIKYKSSYGENRVMDVCRISRDGSKILIYHPNEGRGIAISDDPPEPPPNGTLTFSYEALPPKYWKKYNHAARFVQMVQAKTPKITFYSAQTKCQVMENGASSEAMFYSGAMVSKSATGEVKIIDSSGRRVNVEALFAASSQYDDMAEARALWQHFEECVKHCYAVESALSELHGKVFPITIGRRPPTQSHHATANQFSSVNMLTPRSHNIPSFAMSSVSAMSSRPGSVVRSPTQCHKITIPTIGVASKSSDGIVEVQYPNSTKLMVFPKILGGGVTFTDADGTQQHFSIQEPEHWPLIVRSCYNQIPLVESYISSQSSTKHQPPAIKYFR